MAVNSKAELLLALLYSPDGVTKSAPISGITRLEKLLFLLKKDAGFLNGVSAKDDFNFVPFRMGPWSQEVYDELDFLESFDLLARRKSGDRSPEDAAHDDELFDSIVLDEFQKSDFSFQSDATEEFLLSEKGIEAAKKLWEGLTQEEQAKIKEIKQKFNRMNLRQFLRYVYKKYPDYASKSEIKEYLGL